MWGFGFAAFETSGYAFNALIQADDTKIPPVVETQLVRGLLTPVGHGLWTALLAWRSVRRCQQDRQTSYLMERGRLVVRSCGASLGLGCLDWFGCCLHSVVNR